MAAAGTRWRDNGTVLILVAILFWASNFIIGRAAVGLVSPVALATLRWMVAAAIALILARPHLRQDWPALKAQWRWVLVLSVTGISGFNTLAYLGLESTTAINGYLINTCMASIVALLGFLMFGERLSGRATLGLAIAMAGVVWVVLGGDLGLLRSLTLNRGDLLILAAVLSYAIYMVLLRKRPAVHPMTFLAATFVVGSLVLIPFWLWEMAAGGVTAWQSPRTWLFILYLAVFPSIVSYRCFNGAVAVLGSNRASALTLMTPLIGILLAVIFLGERLVVAHVAGGVLIFAGLVLGRR